MHIGHTIIQDDNGEAGGSTVLFSPWFPREADYAVFSYEQIALKGSGTAFEVLVYHKNTEDTGEGATSGASFSSLSDNIYTSSKVAYKELIRFRYEVKDGNYNDGGVCFVIYRMLAPTWYNAADA
ncbi:MAG: hypothetical protein ACYS5W_21315 [Planctomycetota bacterium]|jgi:hypothetical protein